VTVEAAVTVHRLQNTTALLAGHLHLCGSRSLRILDQSVITGSQVLVVHTGIPPFAHCRPFIPSEPPCTFHPLLIIGILRPRMNQTARVSVSPGESLQRLKNGHVLAPLLLRSLEDLDYRRLRFLGLTCGICLYSKISCLARPDRSSALSGPSRCDANLRGVFHDVMMMFARLDYVPRLEEPI